MKTHFFKKNKSYTCSATIANFFPRFFLDFQKWTKINVQNQNSEKNLGKKNHSTFLKIL